MFSVIIPLYNKQDYILNTIQSVLNQSYRQLEIVVVNDGSTDNSLELVKSISDSRIRILDKKNAGVSSARNIGIEEAKYDWVALLDGDDLWHIDFLQSIYETKLRFPHSDLISTGFSHNRKDLNKVVNNNLRFKKYSKNEYFEKATYLSIINSSSVSFSIKLFSKSGGFDVNLRRGEDLDFWLRLVNHSEGYIKIKNVLSFYNLEVEQQVTKNVSDFKYSFLSKIPEIAKIDKEHYLFAKRFIYRRLFDMFITHPNQVAFFLDFFKLEKPFFSVYRFERMRKIRFRGLINYYLKLSTKYINQ